MLNDVFPCRERIHSVTLSGSRAAGLGHDKSDLDLYVVLADEQARAEFRELLPPAALLEREYGERIDLNPLTVPQVRGFQRRLDAFTITVACRRDLWATQYEYYDWSRMVRLVAGEPIWWADDTGLLGAPHRSALRKWLMAMWSARLSSFLEDATGAAHSGDHLTALAAAEETLRCALEIALIGLDDIYLGAKFLWRRMARQPSLSGLLEQDRLFGLAGVSPLRD